MFTSQCSLMHTFYNIRVPVFTRIIIIYCCIIFYTNRAIRKPNIRFARDIDQSCCCCIILCCWCVFILFFIYACLFIILKTENHSFCIITKKRHGYLYFCGFWILRSIFLYHVFFRLIHWTAIDVSFRSLKTNFQDF